MPHSESRPTARDREGQRASPDLPWLIDISVMLLVIAAILILGGAELVAG